MKRELKEPKKSTKFGAIIAITGSVLILYFLSAYILKLFGAPDPIVFGGPAIVFLLLGISIFSRGYIQIPEKPVLYALLILGEYYRTGTSRFWDYLPWTKSRLMSPDYQKREIPLFPGGNTFFLFYPFFERPILFDTCDQDYEDGIEDVRTHSDRVTLRINYACTWYIDEKNVRKFIVTAGRVEHETQKQHFDKVQKILNGMISEAIRELAASGKDKTPHTWEEATEATQEFVRAVLRKIGGIEAEEKAAQAHGGDANIPVNGLGIVVKRFNITAVLPDKNITKATEQLKYEESQAKAEETEMKNVIDRIIEVKEKTGLNSKESAYLVQSERGKAKRFIYSVEGGTSPLLIPGLAEKGVDE